MTRGTISELADDEVYTSLQSRLNRINDSPKKKVSSGFFNEMLENEIFGQKML